MVSREPVDSSTLGTGEDTTQRPSATLARSKLSLHPSMALAGGGGNSVVSLTFGHLFTCFVFPSEAPYFS